MSPCRQARASSTARANGFRRVFSPGFTRLGLVGVDAVDETNDASARTTPFSASLDASTAINPRVPAIAVSRAAGVTRAIVAPETSNAIFAGQGAIIDTADKTNIVDRPRAFQFVEFGENGARRAGGSRPAAQAWFRNALDQARAFARNPASYDGNSKDALLNRSDAAALVPVVEGRQPLYVHVESGPDILQMLALRREFPALKLVLVGVSEGWTVARELGGGGRASHRQPDQRSARLVRISWRRRNRTSAACARRVSRSRSA